MGKQRSLALCSWLCEPSNSKAQRRVSPGQYLRLGTRQVGLLLCWNVAVSQVKKCNLLQFPGGKTAPHPGKPPRGTPRRLPECGLYSENEDYSTRENWVGVGYLEFHKSQYPYLFGTWCKSNFFFSYQISTLEQVLHSPKDWLIPKEQSLQSQQPSHPHPHLKASEIWERKERIDVRNKLWTVYFQYKRDLRQTNVPDHK